MTDIVEKVAKAIATKALGELGRDYDPFAIQKCSPYARAAIEAMRDPDHDMTGAVLAPCVDRTSTVRSWNKMIDAALGETKSTTEGKLL